MSNIPKEHPAIYIAPKVLKEITPREAVAHPDNVGDQIRRVITEQNHSPWTTVIRPLLNDVAHLPDAVIGAPRREAIEFGWHHQNPHALAENVLQVIWKDLGFGVRPSCTHELSDWQGIKDQQNRMTKAAIDGPDTLDAAHGSCRSALLERASLIAEQPAHDVRFLARALGKKNSGPQMRLAELNSVSTDAFERESKAQRVRNRLIADELLTRVGSDWNEVPNEKSQLISNELAKIGRELARGLEGSLTDSELLEDLHHWLNRYCEPDHSFHTPNAQRTLIHEVLTVLEALQVALGASSGAAIEPLARSAATPQKLDDGASIAITPDKVVSLSNNGGYDLQRTLQIYDPKTNEWSDGPQLPHGDCALSRVHMNAPIPRSRRHEPGGEPDSG